MKKKVVFVSNIGFTITNFRSELLEKFSSLDYEVVIACSNHSDFNDALNVSSYRHLAFPLSRGGVNPFADIKTIIQLYRLFRAERPDLILNYTIKPTIYASLAAWCAGVPKIYSTITGLGFVFTGRSLKNTLLRQIVCLQYKLALRLNQRVFFQNPDDQNEFLERRLVKVEKATMVNGSGVDLKRFTRMSPIINHAQTFIFVGRLLIDKGVREYVHAARIIKSKHPDATFKLVGSLDINPMGLRQKELDDWIRNGYVEYIHFVEDIKPLLDSAAVFVLPSYREGTPRSTLEALAMGMPIITTDAPGCRETVEDGVNGFLVPIKNSDALAVQMEKFISNPDLVTTMGKRSRALAESKYSVDIVNERIVQVILDQEHLV